MATRTTRGTSWALAAMLLGSSIGCQTGGKCRLPPAWGDRDCASCEVDSCDCAPGSRGGDPALTSPPADDYGAAEPRKRRALFGKKTPQPDAVEFDETATNRVKEGRASDVEVNARDEHREPAKRKTALRDRAVKTPELPPRDSEEGAPAAADNGATRQPEPRKERRQPKLGDRTGRARLSDVAGDDVPETEPESKPGNRADDQPFATPPERGEKPSERPKRSTDESESEASAASDETAWWNKPGKSGRTASHRDTERPGRATVAEHAASSTSTRGAPTRQTPSRAELAARGEPARTEPRPAAPVAGDQRTEDIEDYYFQPAQTFARDEIPRGSSSEPEQYPYSRANAPVPQQSVPQQTMPQQAIPESTYSPANRPIDAPPAQPASRPTTGSTAADPGGLQPTQYLQAKPNGGVSRPRIDGIFDLPMIQPGASYRATSTPPLRSRW